MSKLLIVEDDLMIGESLSYYLSNENFNITLENTVSTALNKIQNEKFDLIILDISLPDGTGFDLFRSIKALNSTPVIFLTANDDEISTVKALDMGAEDYITKPFKVRELLSRINVILRRYKTNISSIINIKNIKIDINKAKVYKDGEQIFLTTFEYKIFLKLLENKNVTLTREQILADIWDVDEQYVSDNTLTVYIKRLREKIEDNKDNPKIIVTVRGIGYMIGD